MTPKRLIECLDALGWTTTILSRQLGCREELTRRWRTGARGYTIPEGIAEWLERRAAAALADPPPEEWKRRTREPDAGPSECSWQRVRDVA